MDYLRYGNKTILSLVAHLRTWPVTTNTKMISTKDAFIAHWSNSSNRHLSAYARNITRQKNNAKKYEVKITENDKVTQLVACKYEANILE